MAYEVEITPPALRHLNRLPEKVKGAAVEAILGTIAANPRRAGKELRGEFGGWRSARRGDFRVIYEIDEDAKVVLVHLVAHRRTAYRPD